MNPWHTFVRAAFAECRARGIKPWTGGHPMAWAAELYAAMKEQEDKTPLGCTFTTEANVLDTRYDPEEAMLAAEAHPEHSGMSSLDTTLYNPRVNRSFYTPLPAWDRDPSFYMIPRTRARLELAELHFPDHTDQLRHINTQNQA